MILELGRTFCLFKEDRFFKRALNDLCVYEKEIL